MKFQSTFEMRISISSLPSRERGLKSLKKHTVTTIYTVAPFAGAWIEIIELSDNSRLAVVAPFAGAWIEMTTVKNDLPYLRSLPSRERGLKSLFYWKGVAWKNVAPFAGAWIEIFSSCSKMHGTEVAPFAGAWIEIV